MATTWKAPTWRMPNEKNQSKFESYSLDFNTSGYVSTPINGLSLPNDASLSFWFNANTASAWAGILSSANYYTVGQSNTFAIQVTSGGNIRVALVNDQAIINDATIAFNTNTWNHMVVILDSVNNNLKVYLNSSQYGTSTSTTQNISGISSGLIIGGYSISGGGQNIFDGKLSQVSVFDYTISETQIASLYNSGSPINPMTLKPAPIAYYPLGGNASTGGDPLTATTPNTLSVPNVAVPDASVFESDPGFFDLPGSSLAPILSGISNFTLSLWYKQDAVSNRFLFDIKDGTNRMALQLVNASTNYFYFNSAFNAYSAVDTPINQWNNVVFVFDGSQANVDRIKLYVNGSQITASITGTIDATLGTFGASTLANLAAASTGGSLYALNGEIANTQMWTTSLGATDVTTLYNNGVPLLSGTQPQEANLKAWYKLDQSANWEADTAGNWQIPDAVSSYPQSFDFGDAISNPKKFIEVSRAAVNVTDAICVSAWVKTQKNTPSEGNGQRQAIISNYYSGDIPNNGCWKFHIGDGWANGYTKMTFWCRPASEAAVFSVSQTSGQVITDNTWHHVVVLWNGTTTADAVKIFVDGLLAGQGTASATSPIATSTTSRPSLGKSAADSTGVYGNGYYLGGPAGKPGFLSNVQVWDTALTYGTVSSIGDTAGGQVAQLYNNGVPLTTAIATDNLKGWWKLDNTEFYDTFNTTNKWMINNNGLSTDFNKCFWMNPLAIQVPSTLGYQDGTNAFSGAAWVNISSGNVAIIARQRGRISSTGAYPGWSFSTVGSGAAQGDPEFWLTTNTNGTIRIKSLSYTLQDGKWHFVAFTYDGSQDVSGVKIYVDGYEDTFRQSLQNNLTGTMSDYNTPFMIGGTYRQGNFNNARTGSNQFMSNAMYFESELSASDILTLYNNGTPLNDLSSFTTLKGWWKLDDTATYGNGWTIPDASGNGNTGTSDSTMPSTNRVNLLPTTSNGLSSGMTEQNLVNNNVSTLNGESSGMDTSNLVTSTLTRQVPYNSYSLNFDAGNPDNIEATKLGLTTAISVSAWVKTTTTSNTRIIVNEDDWGSNRNWHLYIAGSNKVLFRAYDSGGSEIAYIRRIAAGEVTDGNWHHICITWDGTTTTDSIKLIIDGDFETATATGTGINTDNIPLAIASASNSASTNTFDGGISNVVAWDKALTSTEILKLYNSGVPGDLSSFNPSPIAWWSLGSDSYFNGTSYICPDLVGSNNGTSSGMDANALIGSAPNSTANGTSTNMAIDANLTGNAPNSSNNSFSVNMDYTDRETSVPS